MKKSICFRFLLPVLILATCSTEGGLQQILGIKADVPVFLDCRPVSSTEMVFKFNAPVRVVSLDFDPPLEINSIEEGNEVLVTFTGPLSEGKKVTADILVEDSGRNTLNVIV
ncbi:MAG: hypothetical protein LBH42_06500, partial [Treponema sp.]|nr:hypothetical protein [Treponema sp.]